MEMVWQPDSTVELKTMANGEHNTKKYWFPANRYGLGWGLPSTLQGWVILTIYLALIVAGIFIFHPEEELTLFVAFTGILSLILIAVCWIKGEPPRWRWGNDK
jgi:lipoprotein signal peptidase